MPFGQMVVFYTRHHCAKVGQIGSILRIIVLWRREQRKRLNAVRGALTRGERANLFNAQFSVNPLLFSDFPISMEMYSSLRACFESR
jgi:hypothetical protein